MRIATYNVENLFTRAKALNLDTWADGRATLEAHARINALLEEEVYTPAVQRELVTLIKALGLARSDNGPFVRLRQNRGRLVRRNAVLGIDIVAKGRTDWSGWVELETELVNEVATRNAAQVVRDVDADVIGIVECEGRAALLEFSGKLLPAVGGRAYRECMLIDGNDERGIDVGLMSRAGYKIGWMRSHADDRAPSGAPIFSRDCPEIAIWTPSGATLWVLVNHFKSRGYGKQEVSDARRWLQAETVRTIYERLKLEGAQYIAVVGDLNDAPTSHTLRPLLHDCDLVDAGSHAAFDDGGRPGTHGDCTAANRLDYILLSPALFARMRSGGIWRKGVWGGKNGMLWPVYREMTASPHAASDHACVWCEIDV
ncbi:MAG: endonuclease/exonuclease/phosphatase family protein [Hyphomicrobiales bacterium]|nr:endonuclease/exonuclease/phosphatase family protein [Hyphomicrobiales bacterium]